jgi:polyhydroxybutyrate depolymerase
MALVLGLLLLGLAQALRAETREVTLPDGRFYRIDLPDAPEGAPLILALHGGGGNPDQFAESSGLAKAAVAKGYAVAFPAGSGRRGDRLLTWNAGYCCAYAQRRGIDEMAFLRAVLADARARFGLDPGRVYITGMSNGSMLAEAFAAQHPDLITAVAGVAGTMDVARFPVQGRVPLLVIHGTADLMVPYAGGEGRRNATGTDNASVAEVVAAFLAPWDGGLTVTERVIDQANDGTSVRITDHVRRGSPILRLITVDGGAHHWPGGRKARLTQGKTAEIEANTEILRFFALHP